MALTLASCGILPQSSSGRETVDDLQLDQASYRFDCQSGETLHVTYLTADPAGPVLLVLRYRDRYFGLAQAVSASGSRYIGHAGLTTDAGLEWWEKGGQATLSRFEGGRVDDTKRLTSCRRASP